MFDFIEGIVITDPHHVTRGDIHVAQFVIANKEKAVSVICQDIYNVRKNDVICLNGRIRQRQINGRIIQEFHAKNHIGLQMDDI